MKKSVGFSMIFLLTFFGIFLYLYRSSGKLRKSIVSAILSALILFSGPLQSNAHGADAFTPADQSRSANRPGLFSSKSNDPGKPDKPTGNGGAGDDGNDDDNGKIPQYRQPESVQKTREQIEELKRYVREFDEDTDSESESEEDQCPASQYKMEKEYRMFMKYMSQKGIEVECDQQRFNDLSVNQETGAEGSQVNFIYHRLEVDLVGLQ
jgi:hypothetical protein